MRRSTPYANSCANLFGCREATNRLTARTALIRARAVRIMIGLEWLKVIIVISKKMMTSEVAYFTALKAAL